MKRSIIIIALAFSSCLAIFAAGGPELEKIKKRIRKVLSAEEIMLERLEPLKGNHPPGEYFKIHAKNSAPGFLYTGTIFTCGPNGCEKPAGSSANEYFRFFLIADPNGTISYIEILEYAATHGHEVSSQGWLRQFYGKAPGDLLVYNKNIDAISGATKSAENLIFQINALLKWLSGFEFL